MRFFLPAFILSIFLFSCQNKEGLGTLDETGDEVFVSEVLTLDKPQMGDFSHPQFSPDDSKLYFTSAGYKGIWCYSFKDSSITQLSSQNGTGYNYVFSEDGKKIYYRLDASTVGNGEEKYSLAEQDIKSKKIKILFTSEDKFHHLEIVPGGKLFYIQKNQPKFFDLENYEHIISNKIDKPVVFNKTNSLNKYYNGKEKEIISSDYNIIWTRYNKYSGKILYYAVGEGAVVADTSGDKENIGDFRAAEWSPAGKFIAYMIDKDDGHQVTASDIFVYSVETGESKNLTKTENVIEMNPAWSHNGGKLAYDTYDGFIKIAKLKYE